MMLLSQQWTDPASSNDLPTLHAACEFGSAGVKFTAENMFRKFLAEVEIPLLLQESKSSSRKRVGYVGCTSGFINLWELTAVPMSHVCGDVESQQTHSCLTAPPSHTQNAAVFLPMPMTSYIFINLSLFIYFLFSYYIFLFLGGGSVTSVPHGDPAGSGHLSDCTTQQVRSDPRPTHPRPCCVYEYVRR